MQIGSAYKGQLWWKSSGADWKVETETIENSVKLMKLRKHLKEFMRVILKDNYQC